jgi:hypothetical protein
MRLLRRRILYEIGSFLNSGSVHIGSERALQNKRTINKRNNAFRIADFSANKPA